MVYDNWQKGTLSRDAVKLARTEALLPVVWLGESFRGYQLTHVSVRDVTPPPHASNPEGRPVRVLVLTYGTCKPEGRSEPSCAVPLQIHVSGPGLAPLPSEFATQNGPNALTRTRELTSTPLEGQVMMWLDNGTTLQIFAPAELREEVVAALHSVNHERGGIPAVPPGGSLVGLNGFTPR